MMRTRPPVPAGPLARALRGSGRGRGDSGVGARVGSGSPALRGPPRPPGRPEGVQLDRLRPIASPFCAAAAHAATSPPASAHALPLPGAALDAPSAGVPIAAASPLVWSRRGPVTGGMPVTCSTPAFKGARPPVAVPAGPVAVPRWLGVSPDEPGESAAHVTVMPVEPPRPDPSDPTPGPAPAPVPTPTEAGNTTAAPAGRPTASIRPCRLTCSAPEISISPPRTAPVALRPWAMSRPSAVCSTRCAALSTMRPSSPTTAVVACSRPAFLTFCACSPMRRATTSPRFTALAAGALTSQATSGVRGLTSVTL